MCTDGERERESAGDGVDPARKQLEMGSDDTMQYNAIQYNKCSSASSTMTWPTVHYTVSKYMG